MNGAVRALLAAALLSVATPAAATECHPDIVAHLTNSFAPPPWGHRRMLTGLGRVRTLASAYCVQAALVRNMTHHWGAPAGIKLALTGARAQARHGAKAPIRGVWLRAMLLKDGAQVPPGYGARPVLAPSLMVVVKDAGINGARTAAEAARHLESVAAIIELNDRLAAPSEIVNAPMLAAINTGARLAIVGKKRPVGAVKGFLLALAGLTLTVSETDATGRTKTIVPRRTLRGQALDPLLWLLRDLARRGRKLEKGDVVSLGPLGPSFAPRPGVRVSARFEAPPGAPLAVSVRFR